MKKLLSLVLVTFLLFSTFAGCDAFLDRFQKSARTTVTEEEWLSAFNSINYSITGSAQRTNTSGNKIVTNRLEAKVTGFSCYRYQTSGVGANKTEKTDYYVVVDNAYYHISNTQAGYIAQAVTNGYADEKFGEVFGSVDALTIFNCLTHTAETGSYKGKYQASEDTTYTIDIAFADGKIVSAHILCKSGNLEISYDFYDFGTTVVDLPEYTIAP